MKIAIPLANGKLSLHFGHCDEFALIDVDEEKKQIVTKEILTSPPHQPGLLPRWLGEKGANCIIAGGMGQRAIGLFDEQNIRVIIGAPANSPDDIVNAYLNGDLKTGENVCDH